MLVERPQTTVGDYVRPIKRQKVCKYRERSSLTVFHSMCVSVCVCLSVCDELEANLLSQFAKNIYGVCVD